MSVLTTNAISVTVRGRVKRTRIWNHKKKQNRTKFGITRVLRVQWRSQCLELSKWPSFNLKSLQPAIVFAFRGSSLNIIIALVNNLNNNPNVIVQFYNSNVIFRECAKVPGKSIYNGQIWTRIKWEMRHFIYATERMHILIML